MLLRKSFYEIGLIVITAADSDFAQVQISVAERVFRHFGAIMIQVLDNGHACGLFAILVEAGTVQPYIFADYISFTFRLDNILSRQERKLSAGRREIYQRTSSWLHASVQGWREVKALNLEKHEVRRYYQFLHTDMLYNAKWINYWTARELIIPALKDEFFMRFGLYFILGLLIVSGNLHIGDLLVFAVYYSLLSNAIQAVSAADADLQAQMPFVDRLMESLKG